MNQKMMMIWATSIAFVMGAAAMSLLKPAPAYATKGAFRECFSITHLPTTANPASDYRPKRVTTIPTGWTVVGAGNNFSLVVCR